MAASSSSRRGNGPVLRSLSPSDSFCSSSTSTFSSSTSTFFNEKRVTPTRVTVPTRASSLTLSPSRSFSTVGYIVRNQTAQPHKRVCSCSPTTHKGSFRCGLHKGFDASGVAHAPVSPINRLHAVRRSAMTNSLVRICGVEGDLVKRALATLIRPSSHSQRRKNNFKPRPSGLSVMSKAHS